MPQLGLILQDQKIPLSNYRKHKLLDKTVREAFQGSPTPRQKEALQIAINTPDIALIQGPLFTVGESSLRGHEPTTAVADCYR